MRDHLTAVTNKLKAKVCTKHVIVMISSFLLMMIVLFAFHLVDINQSYNINRTTEMNLLTIITYEKATWKALPSKGSKELQTPIPVIVVKHTAGWFCDDFESCSAILINLQSWMIDTKNYSDISYNFLIGGDGNIYVGRGWEEQNEFYSNTIDICFMGNFAEGGDMPTDKMLTAGKVLILKGVALGTISVDYIVVNHNQTTLTSSPGVSIYKEVAHWPRFYNGNLVEENGTVMVK